MDLFAPSHLLVWLLIVPIFFVGQLPTFIAISRHHKNMMGIFLVTTLLGWTVVGWLVALILSLMSPN